MDKEFFTCKVCGGHELVVVEEGTRVYLHTITQDCVCGKNEEGVAYKRNDVYFKPYVRFCLLDDEHRFKEEVDPELYVPGFVPEPEEAFVIVLKEKVCCDCFDPNREFKFDPGDPNDFKVKDQEFYVICAGCDREIEFGWSHPNRGGRIWPVERSGFNPWKCWPEPRYRKIWAQRGWLRSPTPEEMEKWAQRKAHGDHSEAPNNILRLFRLTRETWRLLLEEESVLSPDLRKDLDNIWSSLSKLLRSINKDDISLPSQCEDILDDVESAIEAIKAKIKEREESSVEH